MLILEWNELCLIPETSVESCEPKSTERIQWINDSLIGVLKIFFLMTMSRKARSSMNQTSLS